MITEVTQLKPTVIQSITTDEQLYNRVQAKLQLAFGKSYFSIRRWFLSNNPMLTTHTALLIIAEETGKNIDELLNN